MILYADPTIGFINARYQVTEGADEFLTVEFGIRGRNTVISVFASVELFFSDLVALGEFMHNVPLSLK